MRPTLGEICGFDKGDSAHAQVLRIYGKLFDICTGDQFRQFAAPDRYLWLIYFLIYEVENGGIDQFFWNRGMHTADTLEALEAIGATTAYRILKEACDLFPNGQPSDDEDIRQEQLRTINARFGGKHLDSIIPGDDWEPNLEELLLEYRREQGIEPEAICSTPPAR